MCGVLLVDEQNFKRGRCRNRVANYRWGYQNPLSTMKRFTINILHLLILSSYVTFVRKLFLPTIVLNISFIFHSKEKIMFRSLAFYVFHEFTHFKICDIVIDITSHQKLCFQLFWVLVVQKWNLINICASNDKYFTFKIFWFYFEDWKVVLGLFIILIKWQQNEIC